MVEVICTVNMGTETFPTVVLFGIGLNFCFTQVLPQMISPTEARALVSKVLNNNKVEIQRLQREIGAAYRPIMGTCDGFYSLDLSNQMDKICLNRLIELSMTNTHYRSQKSNMGYGMVGDCSQKGNWTGFRNESFKGKPIAITSAFASPMPRTGRLEFDFVSERRPASDDFILSDVRVTNMLTKCFLLRTADRMEALRMLAKSKAASAKTLAGDGTTVYETPKEKAEEIGLHQYNFYENILLRHEQIDKARHNEMVTVTIDETDRLTYANIYSKVTIQSLKEIRRTTRLVVENKQPRRMPRQSAITPKASTLKQSVTKSKMSGAEGTAPVVPINKGELESALATVPVGVGEETSKAQSSEPNTARSSNGASRQQTSRIDTTHGKRISCLEVFVTIVAVK